MTKETENIKAATIIQASIRGFFARRDYSIKHTTIKHCTNYPLFVIGNDPYIGHLPTHLPNDKILLVGTSGLRSLEIASRLGSDCPKLILIDNSLHVIKFWKNLQRLMTGAVRETGIMEQIIPKQCSCHSCEMFFKRDVAYLAHLCQKYGFDKVKHTILHASIISQDWCDGQTFQVVTNLANYHQYQGVYVYASNIVAYVAAADVIKAKSILSNIEHLNPTLAIHTDLTKKQCPESVFYCYKNNHRTNSVLPPLIASFYQPFTGKRKPVFDDDRVEILSESTQVKR